MKSHLKIFLLLVLVIVLTTTQISAQKNKLTGDYHLAVALTDGKPNPPDQMDRTMSFFENNQFMGDISFPGGRNFPFIQGIYNVENDSTIVLHHTYDGKLHDVAWVYNYRFKGDTLCYQGFYTQQIPSNPKVMVKFFVDEKWVRIPTSNKNNQTALADEPAILYKKRTYSLSNDSVKAVLKVIQYSNAVIDYEISITTVKGKIEQKGYALNLSSELNGGVEYESDEKGDALQVNPYISYLCGCPAQNDLEIRISTDKKKVSIYSSRKLRQDLFSDKIKPNEKLEDSVQLFGYLYLEE